MPKQYKDKTYDTKKYDKKWREKNTASLKIKNEKYNVETMRKRMEDESFNVKIKADQAERKRKSRAKKALMATGSNAADPPPSEPSTSASSSAPAEGPDVSPAPVPAAAPSGRRTRAATPSQLLESDQEDAEAPSNKSVQLTPAENR